MHRSCTVASEAMRRSYAEASAAMRSSLATVDDVTSARNTVSCREISVREHHLVQQCRLRQEVSGDGRVRDIVDARRRALAGVLHHASFRRNLDLLAGPFRSERSRAFVRAGLERVRSRAGGRTGHIGHRLSKNEKLAIGVFMPNVESHPKRWH